MGYVNSLEGNPSHRNPPLKLTQVCKAHLPWWQTKCRHDETTNIKRWKVQGASGRILPEKDDLKKRQFIWVVLKKKKTNIIFKKWRWYFKYLFFLKPHPYGFLSYIYWDDLQPMQPLNSTKFAGLRVTSPTSTPETPLFPCFLQGTCHSSWKEHASFSGERRFLKRKKSCVIL